MLCRSQNYAVQSRYIWHAFSFVDFSEGVVRSMLLLPFPPATLPVALALRGSAQLAEPLAAALRCQWAFGFPAVPKPAQQLTHGFYQYPAGMQAVAAAHMLSLLPPGLLHDPFVGGGTTLVEGLRCGRHVIGADVSPLALFASTHHTWLASEDELEALRCAATSAISAADHTWLATKDQVEALRQDATRAMRAVDERDDGSPPAEAIGSDDELDGTGEADSSSIEWRPGLNARNLERQTKLDGGRRDDATTYASWEPLRISVEAELADAGANAGAGAASMSSPADPSPLWFCFAAAQQRSARYRFRDPLATFDATVEDYMRAARALRAHTPPAILGAARPVSLLLSDARELSLADAGLPLADAVLTSPPYAGVYDYLSYAREERARLGARGDAPLMGLAGTPDGRDWPNAWRSSHEMGARKAMRKMRAPSAFVDAWEIDQRLWLAAMKGNLRPGGRAALLVGDGEQSIDALLSTTQAAEDVGLRFVASATISSTAKPHERYRGKRRPEHAILLERPA